MKRIIHIIFIILFIIFPIFQINALPQGVKDDVVKGLNNTMDQVGLEGQKKDIKEITAENTTREVSGLIGKILRTFIFVFLGAIFLEFTIYGGYLWLTSGGNEEQIAKAKKIITSTAVGIFIMLSAYAITYFVIYNVAEKTGSAVPAPQENTQAEE